ncbi:MAG: hypothetical protein IPJ78_12945 [Gemmatimonadetes bacterium]|nr:hypothetical protein [Gemmatimonadota bacterium]
MIKRLAPLFSLCLALGCGSPTGVQASFGFGDPFWIEVGHSAVSRDADMVVRFLSVIENSTCPIDAVCVWAGRAIVEVGVTVAPEPEVLVEIEVTASTPAARQRTVAGRRVEVQELRPPNRLGGAVGSPELRLVVVAVR